jgi:hypothetical protein
MIAALVASLDVNRTVISCEPRYMNSEEAISVEQKVISVGSELIAGFISSPQSEVRSKAIKKA